MGSPGKIYIGQSVQQMETSPDWGAYSKVILKVSDNEAIVAGDDTGLTLEADCPWATQAIADSVLASLQGTTYRPYSASKAYFDPSVELGDAITADGIYSGIYNMQRTLSRTSAGDISAPCDTEVAHEFQYETAQERRFTRMAQEINAEFAVIAGEISAKVSQVGGDNRSFGWSMTESGMSWVANNYEVMRVDSNGVKINGTLNANAVITGTLQLGGDNITAYNLRTGAEWPYQSYGTTGYTNAFWSNIAGGYVYSTRQDTSSYPSYFSCGRLRIMTGLTMAGLDWGSQDIVINGRTYHVMVGQ